jgi:hypothetical protein
MAVLSSDHIRRLLWAGFFAMTGVATPGRASSLEVEECCNEAFTLADVVAFAKEAERKKGGGPFISIVVSRGRRNAFSIAGSSEESPAECLAHAVALRRGLSHAFLFRTFAGYSVHHWDHVKAEYRRVVLFGRDLYDLEFDQGARLALVTPVWDGVAAFRPNLKIVARSILDPDSALKATKDVMIGLHITSATALVRGDGYFWPGSCYPYSLPIQWRDESIDDALSLRPESMFCRVELDGTQNECVKLRVPADR